MRTIHANYRVTSPWFASKVLLNVAKLKGVVCYPQEDAYRCCEARNGEVICNLEVVNNQWLTMYIYVNLEGLGLFACIVFVFYGLVPTLVFWFPSTYKTPQGKRLLSSDNTSPVGLCNSISKLIIPEPNDTTCFRYLSKFVRIFILGVILPFPFYLLIIVSECLGEFSLFFWQSSRPAVLCIIFAFLCHSYIFLVQYLSLSTWHSPSGNCVLCELAGVEPRHTVREEMITHHIPLAGKIFRKNCYNLYSKTLLSLFCKLRQLWCQRSRVSMLKFFWCSICSNF